MLKMGILADKPTACTGFAVVNHNLAFNLVQMYGDDVRIIYFGRFGREKGFAPDSSAYHGYEYVTCEGGVWKTETVAGLIKHYNLDIVYSEDDWYSMMGLVEGTRMMDVPLYFVTPIDGLPIQKEAHKLFKCCRKVFVPNQSYKYIKNGVYLPHSVDWMTFKPCRPKFDKFTFLWIGRAENRKNSMSVIKAYKKIYKKHDCRLAMRTGWGESEFAKKINLYINKIQLPVMQSKMIDIPHERMAEIYSSCHAYINTSKAGGCEMSVLEAHACGLPVLVTDWTFMSENVIDGKTGFTIPIDGYDIQPQRTITGKPIVGTTGRMWGNISVDKLAEKMAWMVENQKEAAQMGIDGLLNVRKYSWKQAAEILFDTIIEDYGRLIKEENK